jgi:ribosomal protein S18 acetylase RimI-like enzyme
VTFELDWSLDLSTFVILLRTMLPSGGPPHQQPVSGTVSPTILPAETKDFLPIAALDRVAWLHTGEQFIADGEHVWRVWCQYATVLVARLPAPETLPESDDIAGALLVFPTQQGEQFLHKIMVHPDRRGQGIGTALMKAALEQAAAAVLLTVDPANAAAVQLYRNFGFEVRQHVRGYYRPHEDRYLMAYSPLSPDTQSSDATQ